MKNILFLMVLFLCGCACSDPRGCHPVEIGNTTDTRQLVREGRDEQTYVNTRAPEPKIEEPVTSNETGNISPKRMDDIEVDDRLDFEKIGK